MKILEIVWSTNRGGTERSCINFSYGLTSLGHKVTVWAMEDGLRTAELRAAGISVVVGPLESVGITLVSGAPPDLVHIHSLGIPTRIVQSLKDWFPFAKMVDTNVFPEWQPFHRLLDVSYQLSEFCLFKYRHHTPRSQAPRRLAVAPNPVKVVDYLRSDDATRNSTRKELGIPESALVVGRHGQPHHNKWSSQYLPTFSKLLDREPEAYLLLISPPTSVLEQLKSSAELVQRHVRVLPALDRTAELSRYLSCLDVYWHFSEIGETFGYVVVEALLLRIPVVTLSTPHRDNTQVEIVHHGRTGYVVMNEFGAVGPTVKLGRCPQLKSQMGAAGQLDMVARFDHLAVARSFLVSDGGRLVGQLKLAFLVFGRGFHARGWNPRSLVLFFRANARSWLTIKFFALLVKLFRYG